MQVKFGIRIVGSSASFYTKASDGFEPMACQMPAPWFGIKHVGGYRIWKGVRIKLKTLEKCADGS